MDHIFVTKRRQAIPTSPPPRETQTQMLLLCDTCPCRCRIKSGRWRLKVLLQQNRIQIILWHMATVAINKKSM